MRRGSNRRWFAAKVLESGSAAGQTARACLATFVLLLSLLGSAWGRFSCSTPGANCPNYYLLQWETDLLSRQGRSDSTVESAEGKKYDNEVIGKRDIETTTFYGPGGEFATLDTDFRVPGRGKDLRGERFDIVFSRLFNSSLDFGPTGVYQPLGPKWTHTYNVYIHQADDWNDVSLYDGSGDPTVFSSPDPGPEPFKHFDSQAGKHAAMVRDTLGATWVVFFPNGRKWYFQEQVGRYWYLTKTEDYSGYNTITLDYDGPDNDPATLDKITDTVGRIINLAYTVLGTKKYLTSVYEPSGRYYEYIYQLRGSQAYDLTQVVKHNPGETPATVQLQRYYYDDQGYMHIKCFPTGLYGETVTYSGNENRGDRIVNWFDTDQRLVYQEMITDDGTGARTSDSVALRKYIDYSQQDKVITYIYEATPIVATDPFSVAPSTPPVGPYYTITDSANGYAQIKKKTTDYDAVPNSGDERVVQYTYWVEGPIQDPVDGPYLLVRINDCGVENLFPYYWESSYYDYGNRPRYIKEPMNGTVVYPEDPPGSYLQEDWWTNHVGPGPFAYYVETHQKSSSGGSIIYTGTDFAYDTDMRLDRKVIYGNSESQTTDYTYNNYGNLLDVTKPEGSITRYHYAPNDTGAYVTEERVDIGRNGDDNQDLVTQYAYDQNTGLRDSMTYYQDFPNNPKRVYYSHDVLEYLAKVTYADGSADSMVYDKRGNIREKLVVKAGTVYAKTTYVYDALDHLLKVTEYPSWPNQTPTYLTRYGYNMDGKLITQIDANGIQTRYSYQGGRLTETHYPNGAGPDYFHEQYTYDARCNLKTKVKRPGAPSGQWIEYEWSPLNRLLKKRYYDPESSPTLVDSVCYTYDAEGLRLSMIDNKGADTTLYSYDGYRRLRTVDTKYNNRRIKNHYCSCSGEYYAGFRDTLEVCNYPDTLTSPLQKVSYTKDDGGRITQVKDELNGSVYPVQNYDVGRLYRVDYPSGVYEKYNLTANNLDSLVQTRSSGGPIFSNWYWYDAMSDRDSMKVMVKKPDGTQVWGNVGYSYDALRRLTAARYHGVYSNQVNSYTYDPVGNRQTKNTTAYTYSYETQAESDPYALVSYPGNTCTYDACGSTVGRLRLSGGQRNEIYYYDTEQRLDTLVVQVPYGAVAGADTQQPQGPPSYIEYKYYFTYDGDGRRTSFTDANGVKTHYLCDGAPGDLAANVIAEVNNDQQKTTKYQYIYLGSLLLERRDGNSQNPRYFSHDALGSTVGITDVNRNVIVSYLYEEFGGIIAQYGASTSQFLYTGQEMDLFEGGLVSNPFNLYYYGARYYDPSIGRFITQDPWTWGPDDERSPSGTWDEGADEPWRLNRYAYVGNGPIDHTDPSGHKSSFSWSAFFACLTRHPAFEVWAIGCTACILAPVPWVKVTGCVTCGVVGYNMVMDCKQKAYAPDPGDYIGGR